MKTCFDIHISNIFMFCFPSTVYFTKVCVCVCVRVCARAHVCVVASKSSGTKQILWHYGR